MFVHKETTESPPDISKIIELSIEYCQRNRNAMPFMDFSTPRMWCAQGCDVALDILPTMQEIMKKKLTGITCYHYFTNAVLAAKDKREVIKKKPSEKILSQEEKDDARAKMLRWLRDNQICTTRTGPQDYAWLDAYENKKALSEERA